MSDQKLLQASSSNDLAWLEEVSDGPDLGVVWAMRAARRRRYLYLMGLSVLDQIREGSTASPALAHCRRL
jgi:hypothetical protein